MLFFSTFSPHDDGGWEDENTIDSSQASPEYAAEPAARNPQNSDYFESKMSLDNELSEKQKLEALLESEYSVTDKLADIGFYIVSAAVAIILVYCAWTFLIKQYLYRSCANDIFQKLDF